jgi:soluble lytic murein transglycosylase-like protein
MDSTLVAVGTIAWIIWKALQKKGAEDVPEYPCSEIICDPKTLSKLPSTDIDVAKIEAEMNNLDAVIRSASGAYGVPEEYIYAVIEIESSFNPFATGGSGEIGLMQLMPSTARWLGFNGNLATLYLPSVNVKHGTQYLSYWLQRGYSVAEMAAAYNAGDARRVADGQFKNQRYVDKFFSALRNYQI